MQHIDTLAPLVVDESYINWLGAHPNIQGVQAAEPKSGFGK
jgi:hypothetical protein